MKRTLIVLALVAAAIAATAAVKDYNPYEGAKTPQETEFTKLVTDTGIGVTAAAMTGMQSYVPMAADTTISVVAIGSDTVYVTICGVRTTGAVDTENLTSPPGVTATATYEYAHFEGAWMRQESASAALIWSTATSPRSALLDSIIAGKMDEPILQGFSGNHPLMLRRLEGGVLDTAYTVDYELRCYPDEDDARDTGDGYWVCGRLHVNGARSLQEATELGVRLPPAAYWVVFSSGATANQQGWARVTWARLR